MVGSVGSGGAESLSSSWELRVDEVTFRAFGALKRVIIAFIGVSSTYEQIYRRFNGLHLK